MHSLNSSFVGSVVQQTHISANESLSTITLIKRIIVISVPLSLAQLAQLSINLAMVAIVGNLGVHQLGAASLSYGLLNATAFAFSSGFCGALETVLSHTYGHNPKSKLYGIYTQRMFLMLFFIALFIAPTILFADRFLLFLGQNEEVAHLVGQFTRLAIWGVIPSMMLELLRRYFACQHLNNPLSVNLVIGALVFPFLLIACVKVFGFAGAPIGWCILTDLMLFGLWLYLVVTKKYKDTWGGWDDAAFRNWGPLLKLALPSMAMMLSEWVALEINNICSGFGKPEELAAFSIVFQLSGVCWGATSGTFIASSVLVGNAIGEGKPFLGRRIAWCCLAITAAAAFFNLTIISLVKDVFPYIFTDNEEVVRIFHSLLKYFFVYHTFDALQSCMMGVLRGCGMQKEGALVILFVYSIVGVPLGLFLFFKTPYGIEALWLGPAFGVTCIGFPCYTYMMFYYIPWGSLQPHTENQELHDMSEEDLEPVILCDFSTPSSLENVSELGMKPGCNGRERTDIGENGALGTPPRNSF